MRSKSASCSSVRKYRSAGLCTRSFSISWSITAGPTPSMSMASRLAKWVRFRWSWAGHSAPVQRTAAPSGSRTTGAPQTGQAAGIRYGSVFSGRRSLHTSTTSGMISPAFCKITVSPTRMSFSSMKSWLCSVALVTVVPARRTGSTTTFGVSTPVRPTCTTISRTLDGFRSGGYL